MKKFFYLLTIAATLTGCGLFEDIKSITEGTDPDFDEYAGMNKNTGTPTGTTFEIPNGVTIVLKGEDADEDGEGGIIADNSRGSGYLVIVNATVTNSTDTPCTMNLPAGLVIVSASGEYQNGLLVKETSMSVPANATASVRLHFYCLNSNREASISGGDFGIGVITDVEAFAPLFDVCKTKKVNIEEHSSAQYITFFTTATRIQEIVWAITQGKTFTTSDIEGFLKKVK